MIRGNDKDRVSDKWNVVVAVEMTIEDRTQLYFAKQSKTKSEYLIICKKHLMQ